MQNTYMRVRGAIGFKKGLGVDEIEFDLSDKTGLVALAGPNGRGKTTLLELMGLYRILASRKGALKHHFFLRDSIVEHKFIYDGDKYHIIWKIDSGSDRSEYFIKVNGESKVNGKSPEYDEYIKEKFGSANLFYNSVFCAQGSDSMASMTPGKIKDLLIEFLQINKLEEYRKTSKSGVEFYQKKLDKLSGQIEICQAELASFENLDDDIKINTSLIENKESSISDLDKKIVQYDTIEKDLNLKSDRQKSDIKRKSEIGKELNQLTIDRDNVKSTIGTENKALDKKTDDLDKDIEAIDLILADKEKIFKAASRIENLGRWEKYFSDCFECAIDEQARFDKDMKDVESRKDIASKKVKDLENDLILDGMLTMLNYFQSEKFELESNKSVLDGKKKSSENDFALMQATKNVETCREKIAIAIDPDCTSEICPALEMVAMAKKELPGLEKIEKDLKKKNDENILEIDKAIKTCAESFVDIETKLRHCMIDYDAVSKKITSSILELEKEIETFDKTKSQLLSDYLVIDEFKGFYKSKKNDTQKLIEDLKHLSSKKSEIEVNETKRDSLVVQSKQLEGAFVIRRKELSDQFDKLSLNILEKENSISDIDKSIDLDIDKKIEDNETLKAKSVKDKGYFVTSVETLKKKSAVLESNLVKKDELSASLKEKNQDKKAFKTELNEWDYLRLACSKTGLQALEIDGAVPNIVTEANTLLEKAFGLDSQINIITQDLGKEVFQIKVIREDGAEDDFGNLSGGQKVWIAKALSLGMTLVSKRKSGRKFDSLYADEEDGALDSEKALEFVKLYRSMMTTGDFETCFFISHNPDVVAMADHVIDFNDYYNHNAIVMDDNDFQRIN